MPEPKPPAGIAAEAFDGNIDADLTGRLNALIARGPFTVHVARTFTMGQAAEAHAALGTHYLGKLTLKIG